MKITKRQLRRIIREERRRLIEGARITDKILAAFDEVGLEYTQHMSQDDEIFIDIPRYNPYSRETKKTEELIRKLQGVVDVYEGPDGMVVEIDWDNVGY